MPSPSPYPVNLNVGGQAVVEGVMMRSPRSFAVACRRPGGEIVLREELWRSLWERWRWLRLPFLRGGVVLAESLVNGFSALTFSAQQQEQGAVGAAPGATAATLAGGTIGAARAIGPATALEPAPEIEPAAAIGPATALEATTVTEEGDWSGPAGTGEATGPGLGTQAEREPEADRGGGAVGAAGYAGLIAFSIAFALALFVGLPHLLTWAVGLTTDTIAFHLVDGIFKVLVLIGYIAAIGLLPDIRRVFMYHGAEHKAIWAYEAGLELTVDNVRERSRFHPRCGTSFLVLVILVSIFLFAVLLRHPLSDSALVDHLLKILIKVPLMFPVAGLAYEGIKLSGKYRDNPVVRALIVPGLALQRLTTREPTDDQLEVALVALRKTLWREGAGSDAPGRGTEVFASYADAGSVLDPESAPAS